MLQQVFKLKIGNRGLLFLALINMFWIIVLANMLPLGLVITGALVKIVFLAVAVIGIKRVGLSS